MGHQSPHDSFVKAVLQQPERARDYFQLQLPRTLADTIDFDTLTLVSESFIDEHLKTSFSDLIYSVQRKGKNTHMYLSLLLEHKSWPDPYVSIQMGHYIFSALYRQVSAHQEPVPVIPVLFYHGEQPMPYRQHREL